VPAPESPLPLPLADPAFDAWSFAPYVLPVPVDAACVWSAPDEYDDPPDDCTPLLDADSTGAGSGACGSDAAWTGAELALDSDDDPLEADAPPLSDEVPGA
jgi:hypothetical protein